MGGTIVGLSLCLMIFESWSFLLTITYSFHVILIHTLSQELLEYKEKFGDCDVAIRKGFEEYKQLANWAGLMRVRVSYS